MERIRKVPLSDLIDMLATLYHSGVDFVDISGKATDDPNMDSIIISVIQSYVDPAFMDSFIEEEELPDRDNITIEKLSDNDINDLLP